MPVVVQPDTAVTVILFVIKIEITLHRINTIDRDFVGKPIVKIPPTFHMPRSLLLRIDGNILFGGRLNPDIDVLGKVFDDAEPLR